MPFAVLGRAPGVDLQLDDPAVARRHLYVQVVAGRLFGIDLLSSTGTHWENGAARWGWLHGWELIQLGHHRIVAPVVPSTKGPASNWSPLKSAGPCPEALPAIALTCSSHVGSRSVWSMRTIMALIGTTPPCAVRLHGEKASRIDCSLVRTPKGVWLVGLLGRGQPRVNGVAVRHARLNDGDQLDVGDFRLHVQLQPAGVNPPAVPALSPAPDPSNEANHVVPAPRTPVAGIALTTTEAASLGLPSTAMAARLVGLVPHALEASAVPTMGLLNQFGALQQQMFDQFQQALLVMSQMFSDLHQEQTRVIHEELTRLRELTDELQALKSELASAAPARWPPGAPGPTPDAVKGLPPPLPVAGQPAAPGGAPPAAAQGTEDVHAWLCQRLDAIQEERQSRWQRILTFLGGKAGKEGKPA
jgi:pSer/pThr/pTyr-binding forkhead associated (FHA) protein